LHVLHICSSSSFNGETAHIYALCRSLQDRGIAVTLAYRIAKHGVPLEIHPRLIEEYGLNSTFPLHIAKGLAPHENGRGLRQLSEFLNRQPIEIVHCHRGSDHALAGVLSTISRTRPIRLVRTRHVTTPLRGHSFNRWLYERCDLILATAGRIRREFERTMPGLSVPVKLFHGGVDTERFSPETRANYLRREICVGADDFLISCVGHLDPVKGYDAAIDALAAMRGARQRSHLLIAGKPGGVSMNDLVARARERGVPGRVHLLGFRRDIPQLMAASDAGLISSTGSEGNSRTALEFMATGLPLISTRVGCLTDLIEDGCDGFLVEAGDVKAMSQRLERLAENAELRRTLGEAARQKAVCCYDNRLVAAEMERLYASLGTRDAPEAE
jgi:glycosyltransferase involved in cell wall biosynthesis